MLETAAHKAFRKKLESLTTKYEPQFPFAKFVSCVNYWNSPNGMIRPYVHQEFGVFEKVLEFSATQIQVVSNDSSENFNRACTDVFIRAYLSHNLRSEGLYIAKNLHIEGLNTPNMYFKDDRFGEVKIQFLLPDVTQSWIKYFEELKTKLDCVYQEIKELGGIIAIQADVK